MDWTPYFVALVTATVTLFVRYVVVRTTHRGSVRLSDAETIFAASESVRNDMAAELKECRKERDTYFDELHQCLERERHG